MESEIIKILGKLGAEASRERILVTLEASGIEADIKSLDICLETLVEEGKLKRVFASNVTMYKLNKEVEA